MSRRAAAHERAENYRSRTLWEALLEELHPDGAEAGIEPAHHESRHRRDIHADPPSAGDPMEASVHKNAVAQLHAARRSALCFSGGGIRSATFGLGVLQGLAAHSCTNGNPSEPRLLGEVDLLSTVSGGGYLGSWFSAWAMRSSGGPPQVIRELACRPEVDWEPEPEPLRKLRTFTNYLNPQLGLFSADTWALTATVLRNILLNWLVLLPLMASILAMPRILYKLIGDIPDDPWQYLLPTAAGLLAFAVAYMVVDLPSAGNARLSQRNFLLFGLAPLLLSSNIFVLYWAWQGYLEAEPGPRGFVFYGIAIMGAGVVAGLLFAILRHRRVELSWVLKGAGFAIIAGALGGLFTCWMTWGFTDPKTDALYSQRIYTWLSVPCLLGVLALSQAILVGLSSTITGDEDREWFSRSTAWILIAIVCSFAFTGIALMPPVLTAWLPSLKIQGLITAISGAIASGLGRSSSVAGTAEKESQESSQPGFSVPQRLMQFAPKLIMPVFLLALAALIATFNEVASRQLTAWLTNPPLFSPLQAIPHPDPAGVECLLVAMLAIPSLFLSRVIDANKFSLHAMYRNRLIRTFLGASNRDRHPNPFTGFDPADNFPIADLPAKPLHVINMTLNLVKGENLAWQQRKGESFTATRYRVGSCRIGYQSSRRYAGGFTVGTAVAVSGAAANPNMGYASSPLLSIIMMLFNARLGAWLPNPGSAGKNHWTKRGPTFSVLPFLDEAFGLTTDRHGWVNLSDGGHFENLGLYEMVLRRCALIIAVDGSGDPMFHFDDLGNAIRKIYVDMGITIDFPHGVEISKIPRTGSRHAAVGVIRYSAVDGPAAPDGTIIYIKSSLTGNEPQDVLNYAAQNPTFPHQSTADQWFDENQFEAYRRLGYHIVEEIFDFQEDISSLSDFSEKVKSYCAGPRATATVK